jgi:hypothetical protein
MRVLLASIIALMSLISFAHVTRGVDKVKGLKWEGDSYLLTLGNFQRPIKISGDNANVPCLENASKSNMQVLLEIDSDIPMIKSCKLYSAGLIKPAPNMQAQEDLPK